MRFTPQLPREGINVTREHRLKEAALLVAGLIGAMALLVFGSGLIVDVLVPLISPKWEQRVFSVPWLLEGDAGEDAEDERLALTRSLVESLREHWEGAPYDFRVAVWQQESPNALAFPGGWIVVTSGLLDTVESENELAFVLAHEIGHFAGRDQLQGLGRGLAVMLGLAAVGFSGGGGAERLASSAGTLSQRSFGREQESAADRFGLELVLKEYGHVGGAFDFFGRLPEPERGRLARRAAHYLSTHPLSGERTASLREYAQQRGWHEEDVRVLARRERD